MVSIYYHPCEFVHKEFWDGVNFGNGANPPREQWKQPKQKTAEETKISYEVFENYVRFMKRHRRPFHHSARTATLYRDQMLRTQFISWEPERNRDGGG